MNQQELSSLYNYFSKILEMLSKIKSIIYEFSYVLKQDEIQYNYYNIMNITEFLWTFIKTLQKKYIAEKL